MSHTVMSRTVAFLISAALLISALNSAAARNVFYDIEDRAAAAPVERVVDALWKSSGAWCADEAKSCFLDVRIKHPNAIEVFYDEQAIWISRQRIQLTTS